MRIFCSVQWKMGGKRDQMAVFELAAAGFGVGLAAVGGDHVGRGPIVAVGEQDPLSEDRCFQRLAGLAVHLPGRRRPAGWLPVTAICRQADYVRAIDVSSSYWRSERRKHRGNEHDHVQCVPRLRLARTSLQAGTLSPEVCNRRPFVWSRRGRQTLWMSRLDSVPSEMVAVTLILAPLRRSRSPAVVRPW
jgi:hypothetical protein